MKERIRMHDRRILTKYETEKLLEILKNRFERNRHLHRSLQWEEVHSALLHDASAMWSISQMEATGGEPQDMEKWVPCLKVLWFPSVKSEMAGIG